MELPHRVGGSYSTPIHPFLAHSSPPPGPLPISTAAVPAVYASSSLSSSSQEVMTPHVDVVVCTCTDRPPNRSHHYEETSVHDASEATPMSGSIVNMEDTHASSIRPPSTPPPAYSHFHSDMSPNACFSPLPQASVMVADLPLQSASVANAHDPLIHSSYSLASSSVTVNQLQRVATGAGLCVSADLLTTSTTGPVCRICHLPYEESKPLLSPCRCSGTLQFVHNACLVKWLEISMKKYRQRVPRCELCNFEYIRRKRFRFRGWRCPSVSNRDRVLHFIFLISLIIMFACAVITIQLFLAEKESKLTSNTSANSNGRSTSSNNDTRRGGLGLSKPHKKSSGERDGITSRVGRGNVAPPGGTPSGQGRMQLTWEEAVTLGCGVTFFVAFFVAMTAQIKARRTVYQLIVKCFATNLIWEIQEYVPEHDKSLLKRRAAAAAIANASRSARAAMLAASASSAAVQQTPMSVPHHHPQPEHAFSIYNNKHHYYADTVADL